MSAENRARGSYSAGLATRESVLLAAMRLIAESGYDGFSLRDVGREVGISHPAVIYHYPSKEALLLAVIDRFEAMIGVVGVRGGEDEGACDAPRLDVLPDNLGEMALQLMRLAKSPDTAILMMSVDSALAVEASRPSHPAHRHYVQRFQVLRGFLVDGLTELSSQGRCTASARPEALADALIRNWYGTAIQMRYRGETDSGRFPVSTVLASSALLLHLTPETVLLLAASVPEDLGDIFARMMRIYTAMAAS